MNNTDNLRLDDNIRFRRVGDEGVVVDQRSAEIMVVTEVAVRTLELIRDTGSLQKTLDSIQDEYEVEPGQAQADLSTFLADLRARNMLTEMTDVR